MLITGPEICHVGRCPHGCQERCEGHAWRALAPAHYERELQRLIERSAKDGVVLPLVRYAQRWAAYSKAAAEASHCKTPMEQIPFFKRLEAAATTRFRSFTAEQFGEWVDFAAAKPEGTIATDE